MFTKLFKQKSWEEFSTWKFWQIFKILLCTLFNIFWLTTEYVFEFIGQQGSTSDDRKSFSRIAENFISQKMILAEFPKC